MASFLIAYGPLIGYILLFLGALLEGETIIIAAGYFAFKGFLDLPLVIIVAFLGTILTDQVLFFVGRHHGAALLKRNPKLQDKAKRIFSLLNRYQSFYILSFRFIYGIRIASPLIIGTSGIAVKRFIVLDLIASIIWCPLMGVLGYLIGYYFHESLETIVRRIINFEETVVMVIAFLILGVGGIYYFHRNRKQNET